MKKQIYIVDDHPLVVDALQNLISKSDDLECIGSADTIEKAFNDIESLQPGLVLIDIQRGHAPAIAWFASLQDLPSVPGFVVMEL
ncbi:MAG: response regulator, partial [Leptospira sp.]|nr:response regulator [Leptospira sp.]